MDDITKIRQMPHSLRTERKKKYRYNDSLRKYRKTHPINITKKYVNPKEKFEIALENLKEGLAEITAEFNDKNPKNESLKKKDMKIIKPMKRLNHQNPLSLSMPKYHFLRTTTPKRNYPLLKQKKNYLDSSNPLQQSFFTTANDKMDHSAIYKINDKMHADMTTSRGFSRPNYRGLLPSNKLKIENGNGMSNFIRLNNMNLNTDIKNKELNNLNNILERQNKELRQNTREMRYKINDLLNNIKLLRMDNQRLNSDKNKLLVQISNLENELDISKNLSMNELELKSNQIAELNEDIMRLNLILDEKENEIISLNNKNGKGINELNDIDIEDNNNINISEYINQINALKEENEFLKSRNTENGQINNNESDEIINKLTQENQQFKKLYNNLKNEYEKMKNYYSNIKNQQNSFSMQQNEYQQNINDLNFKLSTLQEENNNLKNLLNNQNNMLRNKKQGNNNINNNETQLKNQLDQLLEENNMLKEQIEQNNYNNDELKYLKNDVEEKNSEIKDLNGKIKELMSQISVYKNISSDLTKENEKFKKDLEQRNNKIKNLETQNINNQQQIRELNNLNNKLKIKVYSIDSGSLNFSNLNKQLEQQVKILKQKNEELEEKLLNSKNNVTQEKKELTIENTELKNEILNLKTQIKELENENHNNILQICKLDEMEKQLKQAKSEAQRNFNELKTKDNENKKLLDIIKNKEQENFQLQNKLSNKKSGDDINRFEDNEEFKQNINDNNENMEQIVLELAEYKKDNEEKDIAIEKLNKEIEEFKNVNNQLLQENAQTKEKSQLLQNEQDDGLMITLDNLKEELKDKSLQIEKLIEENNSLRNNAKNNINKDEEDEKEVDLNNKNEMNPFRNTVNSAGLNDAEKIKIYKDQIKELKVNSDSDQIQIKTLKADIKDLKAKIKNIQTFSGQLKDFNEFLSLLNKAMENYKPKKKEQKDAFNKLVEVMNNFHN